MLKCSRMAADGCVCRARAISTPPRMKAVVTILQNRRVALPHIFTTYVLPEMRRLFPGEVDCVLVQHTADASGGQTQLESLNKGPEGMERVRAWTEQGKFPGAEIISHDIIHRPYPLIPSLHRAVEQAVTRKADFHLWMEDDALVFDRSCSMWPALIRDREVGVYPPTPQHLHTAFLVTTRRFDERILPGLADYPAWDWRHRRIEHWLRRQLRTRRAYLPRHYAVRDHPRTYPYTGLRYVVDALRGFAPEAIDILDVDFGPGCRDLPPVTHEELAADYQKERRGFLNRWHRVRQAVTDQVSAMRDPKP